ncbi:MAG: hypothetical protein KDE31_07990, partial [Caldilineaceae bacterium]|nr:hypothetical protein [Caldilineaceae bacterium]
MTHYAFRFLGQFQFSVTGTPVTNFHSDKARALLAYLALEPQAHKRDFLAALLWPDIDDRYARTNLRNTLYRLRLTLDDAAPGAADQLLIVTRQSVQFKGESASIDVHRFQTLIDGALADPAAHLDQLAEAVNAYQGELLAGFNLIDAPPFEEWLLLQREMLHLRALMAFQALVTAYEASGNFSQALAVVNRLLVLDPFREESHRQLMQLLARMGQPVQALRQLEQLRRILRAEMEVEPSPETLALAKQIVAGDFAKVAGGKVAEGKVTDTSSFHRVTLSPPHPVTPSSVLDLRDVPDPGHFFGRVQEQQQLTQWLLHDRCRVVAILGIGGMGKTSLAAQWVREAADVERAEHLEAVLWRSLLNAPPLAELLPPLLQELSDQQLNEMPESLDAQLRLLLGYLRARRVLLVLDNLESILEP